MEKQVQNCLPPPQFIVTEEQKRQLSLNHSIITSICNCRNTYEQLLQHFKNYETNKIDIKSLHQSKMLRLKKYKDSVYYGEYLQKKREGVGIMLYNNGQIYQGFWKNDLRHGQGYERFANGCWYQGQHENGKMHGLGRYVWMNGDFYQGEWTDNTKNGAGIWKNTKGNSYIGEWKNGQADGIGTFIDIGGSKYQGQFHHFLKQGKGTEEFQSEDIYKGEYFGGKFQGFGEYFWKDGSFYKGNFKNGIRSGHGLWVNGQQKDKYEGQYLNNKRQGYGIYTWRNGDIYKGNYKDNIRSGYGEMYWQDGSFYKGQWKVDKYNGEGVLFDEGNGLMKGVFQNGKLVSKPNQKIIKKVLESTYKQSLEGQKQSPIKKINKQYAIQIKQQPNQFIKTSPFNTLDRSRPIRYNQPYSIHPLLKSSLLPKKRLTQIPILRNSEHLLPYAIRYSQSMKKKTIDEAMPKSKIPHSALQIYKLHRNKLNNSSIYESNDFYSEREPKTIFKAFKRKQLASRNKLGLR